MPGINGLPPVRPVHSYDPKRFIHPRAMALINTPMVGDGECVALVQHFMLGIGNTHTWKGEEKRVIETNDLQIGTVVANLENGKWPGKKHGNHVGFFYRYGSWDMEKRLFTSFFIIEQFNARGMQKIQLRELRSKGHWKGGEYIDPSNNADAFYILSR